MARDPQVDLILSHFTPRYVATGVDPNDLPAVQGPATQGSAPLGTRIGLGGPGSAVDGKTSSAIHLGSAR